MYSLTCSWANGTTGVDDVCSDTVDVCLGVDDAGIGVEVVCLGVDDVGLGVAEDDLRVDEACLGVEDAVSFISTDLRDIFVLSSWFETAAVFLVLPSCPGVTCFFLEITSSTTLLSSSASRTF